MKVQLKNLGPYNSYTFLDNVNFNYNIIFDVIRKGEGYVQILAEHLQSAGAKPTLAYEWSFSDDEYIVIEVDDTPCDIINKCCNQFGERDEIQAIIDKLRADVEQRDERIKTLEGAVEEMEDEMTEAVFILQSNSETRINDALVTLNAPYREVSNE